MSRLRFCPKISYDGPGTTSPALPGVVTSAAGGFLAGGTYYYKVSALFGIGESAASGEKSIAVTGPTGKVTGTIPAVAGALGYRVYRSTVSGAQSGYFDIVGTNVFVDVGQPLTFGYPSARSVNVSLSLPQRPWNPKSKALVGGSDTVPSGAGEAFVIQWGELAAVTFRFYEWGTPVNEQEAVRAWWKWAATTRNISYVFFDQAVNTAYAVYVDGPGLTDGFEPVRNDGYRGQMEQDFLLRIGDNLSPINPAFSGVL